MPCQIGIYRHPTDGMDDWIALIDLADPQPPRDLLREMTPFLREFHARQDMADGETLAAWLTWYLIDSSLVTQSGTRRIALGREVRSDISYFCRICPGTVEMYSVDELLEWRLIAAAEIPQEPVPLGAEHL